MATKDFSSKQEHMVARYLNWKVVTGSGARSTFPGDVIGDKWLGECKTHVIPGHKLVFDLGAWTKIKNEAASKFKYPVLVSDDGSQKESNTWCMYLGSVTPSTAKLISFPFPYRNNISVDVYQLNFKLRQDSADDRLVVYFLTFGDDWVHVTSLENFRRVVEGD